MLKLFGMFFLFLILFFVVFVLCLAYRIRATLRSVLINKDMRSNDGATRPYSQHEPKGMVIDVEAKKR